MRYVALGDSYTSGTSVAEAERWPNQLAARIDELELVANLARNGDTTEDVIGRQLSELEGLTPELVSLLVGVNDAVQAVPDSQYAANVAVILEELVAQLPPGRIVCVATPDSTLGPIGGSFGDPAERSDLIVRFNAILREACEQRGIAFVPEIFEVSQPTTGEPPMAADDGLHANAEQYSRWVDVIEPVVRQMLES